MINLQARGFAVTAALSEYVQRRLGSALMRRREHIRHVSVCVGDENGPRGGTDKYCRIRVDMASPRPAMIVEVGSDLYAAIDRAADRVGRAIHKQLERRRVNRTIGRSRSASQSTRPAGRTPAWGLGDAG